MSNYKSANRSHPRFSIRTAMLVTMLIAIALGWYSSMQRAKRNMTRLFKRLEYSEAELDFATSRSEQNDENLKSKMAVNKGLFSHAQFNRVNMQGVSIAGEFHYASFEFCMLQDANLSGGASAFQFAQFNHCNLVNAKLSGGGSAFQMSSFEDADLTGAVLTGGGSSFQRATFQRANLTGTQIICPAGTAFQGVNIDSAQFQGADLSAIGSRALESCFFDMPPSYDSKTRFPNGFDPSAQLWSQKP